MSKVMDQETTKTQEEEKRAVDAGYWFNYRYDPRLKKEDKNPFHLDSKEPSMEIDDFIMGEVRYNSLYRTFPEEAKRLHARLALDLKEPTINLLLCFLVLTAVPQMMV